MSEAFNLQQNELPKAPRALLRPIQREKVNRAIALRKEIREKRALAEVLSAPENRTLSWNGELKSAATSLKKEADVLHRAALLLLGTVQREKKVADELATANAETLDTVERLIADVKGLERARNEAQKTRSEKTREQTRHALAAEVGR